MGANIDLERIESAFAEAAVDPSRWNEAMDAAAAATGCAGALLFDSLFHLPMFPHSEAMDGPIETYLYGGC
ncbi:hypothetical protein QO004_003293 [Rhizobium mesoamericanum]|uniref:hypothetical protein n=1 Tax=Rhizobium mesoamericanum TaxID=1079800 RepID=UPI002789CDED|nr:hypothetical protein [Rhizobium mesoamericanum]MDQ0561499.1 hypothetical protein [Rhizobium mesoamericanum]